MRDQLNASRDKLARAARTAAGRLHNLNIEARLTDTIVRLRDALPKRAGARERLPYHVNDSVRAQSQIQAGQRPVPPAQPGGSRWSFPGLQGWFSSLRAKLPDIRLPKPGSRPALSNRRPASEPRPPVAPQSVQNGSAPQVEMRTEWLAAHGLEKSFGGRKVVNGVTLGLRRGEVVGLLGPNGAGKTTTFYMITGLIAADAGAIELDGFDVTHLPMYRRARLGVGYLPQEPSIFRGMTVEENIMAVLELVEPNKQRRAMQLDSLLQEFSITKVRKSPAIALSGGERRRVEIARALASRPVFMLLDEPFAGIDPIAVNDIRILVRHLTKRGIGVLITDHNVRETLGLIDRAYIIHDGQVLMEGTPQAVVANDAVRQHYLGEDFTL